MEVSIRVSCPPAQRIPPCAVSMPCKGLSKLLVDAQSEQDSTWFVQKQQQQQQPQQKQKQKQQQQQEEQKYRLKVTTSSSTMRGNSSRHQNKYCLGVYDKKNGTLQVVEPVMLAVEPLYFPIKEPVVQEAVPPSWYSRSECFMFYKNRLLSSFGTRRGKIMQRNYQTTQSAADREMAKKRGIEEPENAEDTTTKKRKTDGTTQKKEREKRE